MRAVHEAILGATLQGPPPNTLLDVGCGNGSFTRLLAAALPNASITAIDAFAAKDFVPSRNVTFVRGCAEDLPFESESFDVVVAALSLHHWADKGKGIVEAYRVLRKGGRLIIGDPLLEDWMSNRFWGWLMQAIDNGAFTDRERLTGYLDKAGFERTRVSLVPNSMNSLYLVTASKRGA